MDSKATRTFRFGVLAAAVFFMLCYLGAVYLSYRTSAYIFDSDASSELVLSKLLSEEGGVVSENWYYSTELRVLNTQLVFSLLFRFLPDFRTVRVLGMAILLAIYAWSFLFCAKQAGIRRTLALVFAGFLMLPGSVTYARIILMHGYYVPHVTIGFLLTGLVLGTWRSKRWSLRFWLYLVFLVVLSAVAGLGGIRQLIVTYVPLVAVVLLLLLRRRIAAGKSSNRNDIRNADELSLLLFFFIGAMACCVGYAWNIYVTVLSPVYKVQNIVVQALAQELHFPRGWGRAGRGLLRLFGVRGSIVPFTLETVSSLLGIASLALSLTLSLRLIFTRSDGEDTGRLLFGSFFCVALAVQTVAMVASQNLSFHYLIPATAWLPALLAATAEQGIQRRLRLPGAAVAAVLAITVFASLITDKYLILEHSGEEAKPSSTMAYDGLIFQDVDITRKLRGAADFLSAKGYCYGYAGFWNGNVVQEMTDGRVRPMSIELYAEGPTYVDWLTSPAWRAEADSKGRVFVLTETSNADSGVFASWLPSAAVAYADRYYTVYSFENNAALRSLLER